MPGEEPSVVPNGPVHAAHSHSFEEAGINKARNARELLHLWGMAPQISSWDQYLRFRLTGVISLQVSTEDSNAL